MELGKEAHQKQINIPYNVKFKSAMKKCKAGQGIRVGYGIVKEGLWVSKSSRNVNEVNQTDV